MANRNGESSSSQPPQFQPQQQNANEQDPEHHVCLSLSLFFIFTIHLRSNLIVLLLKMLNVSHIDQYLCFSSWTVWKRRPSFPWWQHGNITFLHLSIHIITLSNSSLTSPARIVSLSQGLDSPYMSCLVVGYIQSSLLFSSLIVFFNLYRWRIDRFVA